MRILALVPIIVVVAAALTVVRPERTFSSFRTLEARWSSAPLRLKLTLGCLVAVWFAAHVIEWRGVLLDHGASSASGLIVLAVVPWLVTVVAFFGPAEGVPAGTGRLHVLLAKSRWPLAVAVGLVVVGAVGWLFWRSNGAPVSIDESLYLFQARLLEHGRVALQVPASWKPFLAIRGVALSHGRLFSRYPPGWPAMLAGWSAFAPPWLLGPALGGILIVSAFVIGRGCWGREAGALTAVLVATSASLLFSAGSLMSDLPTTSLMAAAGALGLLGTQSAERTRRLPLLIASGVLLGAAFACRPLTGLAMTPLVVLLVTCGRENRGPRLSVANLKSTLPIALGALPMIVGVLVYNHLTTGSILEFGYKAAEGALQNLGFGIRGTPSYDRLGNVVASGSAFTPMGSLIASARRLAAFDAESLGGFLVPIVASATLLEMTPRRIGSLLLAGALLPFAYFFWFYSASRFYLPLVPLMAAITAACVIERWRVGGFPMKRFVTILVLGNLALFECVEILDGTEGDPAYRYSEAVAIHSSLTSRTRSSDSTVVFVRDAGDSDATLSRLYYLNASYDSSPRFLVVRNLGQANRALLRQLPGWSAVCVDGESAEVRSSDLGQGDPCPLR